MMPLSRMGMYGFALVTVIVLAMQGAKWLGLIA